MAHTNILILHVFRTQRISASKRLTMLYLEFMYDLTVNITQHIISNINNIIQLKLSYKEDKMSEKGKAKT